MSRTRRLRTTTALRNLVQETRLSHSNLIMPLFIKHGNNLKIPIKSMPGHYQFSLDKLKDEIKELASLGIPGVILFGIPKTKDAMATSSYQDNGIITEAIKLIKDTAPELLVIADVCCCEYTDHGHCGVIKNSDVDNDATLPILAKQAVTFAKAGADIVAPSSMMDKQVAAIRQALDQNGFIHTPILSYSAKYASSWYGPFREAAEGSPKFGDRKTYQMDPANGSEALKEAQLDLDEGADMLMVKPAHSYLDIIYRIKTAFPATPLCAYHVSGEFAAIKAAAMNGWIDETKAVIEVLTSIKRAGSDFIITYFAKDVASNQLR